VFTNNSYNNLNIFGLVATCFPEQRGLTILLSMGLVEEKTDEPK
jgi:hypothetical protein